MRRFRIEATHPAYIGTLQRDSFEAGLDRLHAPGDPTPARPPPPKRTTLYEEIDFWLSGLTFANFWRPATTPPSGSATGSSRASTCCRCG